MSNKTKAQLVPPTVMSSAVGLTRRQCPHCKQVVDVVFDQSGKRRVLKQHPQENSTTLCRPGSGLSADDNDVS